MAFKSPRTLIEMGETTLPDLYAWHAKHNPHYPLFRFHDGHGVRDISYADAFRAIDRCAAYVRTKIGTTGKSTVGILANTDTITYCCTSAGIIQAGHLAFHISTRNGSAAVADLLRRTDCKHILVSQDDHITGVVREALRDVEGIEVHQLKTFDELFTTGADEGGLDRGTDAMLPNMFDSAILLHSSGSTNHPKPVYWTHKRVLGYGTVPWYGEVDLTGLTIGAHGVPMFHAMGLCIICTALCNGAILAVFKPASPPTFPTAENIFEATTLVWNDYLLTVPAFIEQWSRDPNKVSRMQRMTGLMFGGAPLAQEVGDTLAAHGISLITLYGCTEVGTMSNFVPAKPGMDWAYFKISAWNNSIQIDAGKNKYEIVILSNPECPLNVVNSKVDGRDAYATNDLVEAHPTKPGLWRIYGRKDEQIILSNGEKTNPVPIEHILNENPYVSACIVFGHGKFQNGVLVQPPPEYQFDPEDKQLLRAFRNMIWPTVERANEFAPQHSRIFKEMILITSPSKPLELNAKGYPRRAPNLKRYLGEIESIYTEVERSAQSDVLSPATWSLKEVHQFVKTVVEKVMQRAVLDDADLFRSGCDSLQATWIRNTILRVVREHFPDATKRLPTNLVFQAPSVAALADAVLRAVHDTEDRNAKIVTEEDLVQLAEKYSSNLPSRPSNLRPRNGGKDIVAITGTTGGFGCDLLHHLLLDDEIGMVYAFNRKGSNAMDRQRARFRERGLDESLLESPKFKMVEAELDVPGLSVEPALLDEVSTWRVDFNLSLPSFETDLKGVRNFVELALSFPYDMPPRINFVSSVGIFGRCTLQPPVPEIAIPPAHALDTGYSESKWVAEKILSNVAERAGVPSVVVRLGQVCGDRLGHWNEKEWFPALVKSALFTRCLPGPGGVVSFIPSYSAARAFVEMRNAPGPLSHLHLVHPRPVPFRTLVAPIAAALAVPLVPYAAWLRALEASLASRTDSDAEQEVDAMRANPALRLLDFFRTQTAEAEGRVPEGKEPMGVVRLATDVGERTSAELARLPPLDAETSMAWVAAWRRSGFLPDPDPDA
ncbi:hypothetical protein V8D89_002461, partial [Ganoderma adspersum]